MLGFGWATASSLPSDLSRPSRETTTTTTTPSRPGTRVWEGTPDYGAIRVPERNPTWPLPAESSLDLLLCLIVSIQGMIGLRNLKQRIDKGGIRRRNKLLAEAFNRMIARSKTAPAL